MGNTARTVRTPASRRHDPATSALAESSITRSGERDRQQRIVRVLVEMFPGSTSAELAQLAERYCLSVARNIYNHEAGDKMANRCQLDRWQIARRLPECETAGTVERAAPRKCSVKGRKSLTWVPLKAADRGVSI